MSKKDLVMSDNNKIKQLLKSIDPKMNLTPDAEKMVIMMVNNFIADVTDGSCRLAEMRGSERVDVSDLALYLKKNWDIDVEGYSMVTTNSDRTISV